MLRGEWRTLDGLSTMHFVEYYNDGSPHCGELCSMSLCGSAKLAPLTSKTGRRVTWLAQTSAIPMQRCKRCEALLKKAQEREEAFKEGDAALAAGESAAKAATETPKIPEDARAFTMNMFMQVGGPTIPLTYIPVPDVEVVIEMLKRLGPVSQDDPCRIQRDTLDATIINLRRYIDEAKERCQEGESTTWTWMPSDEKEDEK